MMLNFFGSLIGSTVKCLSLVLAVNIVMLLLRGGKETIRDLRDTILMAIKVLIQKTQAWLFKQYKEPEKKKEA